MGGLPPPRAGLRPEYPPKKAQNIRKPPPTCNTKMGDGGAVCERGRERPRERERESDSVRRVRERERAAERERERERERES